MPGWFPADGPTRPGAPGPKGRFFVRLRTGLRVLWRARDEVQIGTDPRWAVRLTDLSTPEIELLRTLDDGATARGLRAHARALGVTEARWEALRGRLDQAQVTMPDDARARLAAGAVPPATGPDAATWTRVLADGAGPALLAGRRERTVGLLGAGRLGLSMAVTLAAAGVGTVLVEDDLPVLPADLGVGGYTLRDLQTPRREAAARVLRTVAPAVCTTGPPGTRPDVMVLVEHGAADAYRGRVLLSTSVVHLSVVVREADVVVGPLVVPGASACLRCLDLHRTDADGRWPAVAAQLAGTRAPAGAGEESVLAAIAGALAAGQVLAQLDGTGPRTRGAAFEIGLPDTVPRVRDWPVHPECGCTGLVRTR
ncbi:ThiF family adenylyltransferase [Pengzhenrongella frigida]|uniref:Thiamine biosynthesis protein ThiF n=1 Tax=Pengzhenrongella frigida TaxID=1259133 RepID=A0A4Q5MXW3_9MICO|nr:thiamine biosynthesis protein ThiF [Cellulomonas sp. HLT2-17]RYV50449.1 thiamine biosynthesis protein ThiF [Cellulomonas sp. HLT2-17]